jgi:hypothetical protein
MLNNKRTDIFTFFILHYFMTNLLVINPVEFKLKEHATTGYLESSTVKTISDMFAAHLCFKDDIQPIVFNRTYPHKAKPHHHHHHNKPPQKYKPTSYSERLERDVGGLLNKINSSNYHVIEQKLLKLVNGSNVDSIFLFMLKKTYQQDVYTDLFVKMLKKIIGLHETMVHYVQELSNDFTKVQASLFEKVYQLDYSNYDDFCQFGKLKTEILVRQNVLHLFFDIITFDGQQYIDFLQTTLQHSAECSLHVTNVVLTLISDFMHISVSQRRQLYTCMNACLRTNVIGKKNEFFIQKIISDYNRDGLQENNCKDSQAPPE